MSVRKETLSLVVIMRSPSGAKIGRNDPCWCQSGKKYKRCHLNRDSAPKMSKQEAFEKWRDASAKEECSHPDAPVGCSGMVILAHTIQRSGGIERIAQNGHVLQIRQGLGDLTRSNGRLEPVKTGVKKASTYRGFCSAHDAKLFAPVETQPLVFSAEQCFLLGYRAFCFARYAKKVNKEINAFLLNADAGQPVEIQEKMQWFHRTMAEGIDAGIAELDESGKAFASVFQSTDFTKVGFAVFEFDQCPDFLCSAFITVDRDFQDRTVQDMTNLKVHLDHVAFTLVPTITGGAAIFTWVRDDSKAVQKLIDSLDALNNDEVAQAITRFAFSYCDNVCISPVWWDKLLPDHKEALLKRMEDNLVDMSAGHGADGTLQDDGVRAVSWKVTNRLRQAM